MYFILTYNLLDAGHIYCKLKYITFVLQFYMQTII